MKRNRFTMEPIALDLIQAELDGMYPIEPTR
jgi:hypothetical protein